MKFACNLAVLFLALWAGATFSQAAGQAGKGPAPAPAQAETSAAQRYFTDTVLINQNGENVRFYSDLLKNRVVVINTFFTECVTVCPLLNRNMQAVQDRLGDRLNRDVLLLSISVDPATDTPRPDQRVRAALPRQARVGLSYRQEGERGVRAPEAGPES